METPISKIIKNLKMATAEYRYEALLRAESLTTI
jgi:hypothetical protein